MSFRVFHEHRFPKNKTKVHLLGGWEGVNAQVGMNETGRFVCLASLCKPTWPHLTFRVCTPPPQLSGMFTKVTLHTLHGSATHRYWLQSLWQGTTSYT